MTALQGTPTGATRARRATIIYPYDQTVFPLGLLAPGGAVLGGIGRARRLQDQPRHDGLPLGRLRARGQSRPAPGRDPAGMWDGALSSAQPTSSNPQAVVVLSIVKAASGVAYGPAQAHLIIAPGQLTGVIYYESYSGDALPDGGTDFGLWAVKPGSDAAAVAPAAGLRHLPRRRGVGEHDHDGHGRGRYGPLTGVFRIETDGGYTQLATSPANLPYPITGNVDSRGLGWGTVSPDGKVVLRGARPVLGRADASRLGGPRRAARWAPGACSRYRRR